MSAETTEKLLKWLGEEPIGTTEDGQPIYAPEPLYPKPEKQAQKFGALGADGLARECRKIIVEAEARARNKH